PEPQHAPRLSGRGRCAGGSPFSGPSGDTRGQLTGGSFNTPRKHPGWSTARTRPRTFRQKQRHPASIGIRPSGMLEVLKLLLAILTGDILTGDVGWMQQVGSDGGFRHSRSVVSNLTEVPRRLAESTITVRKFQTAP